MISGTWSKEKCPKDEPDRRLYYRAKPFDYHELLAAINLASPALSTSGESHTAVPPEDWRSIAAHPPKFR